MGRLLQLLFFGHVHKWKIISKAGVFDASISDTKPVRVDYDCQCEICGKVRVFKC